MVSMSPNITLEPILEEIVTAQPEPDSAARRYPSTTSMPKADEPIEFRHENPVSNELNTVEKSSPGQISPSPTILLFYEKSRTKSVEISRARLRQCSQWMVDDSTSDVHIDVVYNSVFEQHVLPYLLQEQFELEKDNILRRYKISDENMFECYSICSLLGLDLVLEELRFRLIEDLGMYSKMAKFRMAYIPRKELLQVFLWTGYHYGRQYSEEEITNDQLHALLYWLKDSPASVCQQMNSWFASQLRISWVQHLSRRSEKGFSEFLHGHSSTLDKFFTASELMGVVKRSSGFYKTCLRCGCKVHRDDQSRKNSCVGKANGVIKSHKFH